MTPTAQGRAAPHRGTPPARASYRDVLGVAEFRAIFAADIVSMLGNVVAAVALTVLVYQQTRSPALAASVMALSFLPYLIGGTLLGAAADRLPARRVLVACDLASAALIGCMIIPGVPLLALLALLFAIGLLSPVYQGVRSAVLPEVLPSGSRYVLGRALMRMVAQSAQVVGYGVGGLLLSIVSPRGALAADALSFVASALVLRFGTAARPGSAARRGSMARDSLAGLRMVFAHLPTRRILMFSCLVPACVVAPEALAAPYAAHIGQPGRAAVLRPAGRLRRQPRSGPGRGATGGRRAWPRLGRWGRRPAHRNRTARPAQPRARPGRSRAHVHPGRGIRTMGHRRTVPARHRCHPSGRNRRCIRGRHPAATASRWL